MICLKIRSAHMCIVETQEKYMNWISLLTRAIEGTDKTMVMPMYMMVIVYNLEVPVTTVVDEYLYFHSFLFFLRRLGLTFLGR